MKAYIYSEQHLIGETNLVPIDVTMGCVQGIFKPTEYYVNSIRLQVWIINNKPSSGWRHLQLSIQLETGYFLHPIGGCTINDITELPNEPITIDIMGLQEEVIRKYFSDQPIVPFISASWDTLSIERKLTLEEQLKKEVPARERKFPWLWSTKNKHVLAGIPCAALCADGGSDDVLFSVTGMPPYNFAMVHLTWGRPEPDPAYPLTSLFETYEEFQQQVLEPLKEFWTDEDED